MSPTTLDATLDALDTTSQTLTDELGAQAWDNANTTLRQLRTTLEALGHHLDNLDDDDQHDALAAVYNAVTEQHNQTVDLLYDHQQYEGWRIGDTRPCGCPVEAISIPCAPHEHEWGQAMTDCAHCQFGVPGVRHWNHGCQDPK